MTRDGQVAIPLRFDYVGRFVGDRAVACLDVVVGYDSYAGLGAKRTRFPQVENNLNQIMRFGFVERDGVWGFYTADKNFIVLPQFEPGWPDLRGNYPHANGTMVTAGRRCGFLDPAGNVLVSINFGGIREFSDGLAALRQNEQAGYGFIDKSGRFVVAPRFERALDFSDGLAAVMIDGRWGFIDRSGKLRIKPRFDDVRGGFYQQVTAVQKRGKWGLINASGRSVGGFLYDDIDWLEGYREEGLVGFRINEKEGFIDLNGLTVIDPVYDYAGPFREGLASVERNGKYGFIDRFGKAVIGFKYDDAGNFSEGLAKIVVNGKVGYIDRMGQIAIEPQYDDGDEFSEGLVRVAFGPSIPVRIAGKSYGFIDRNGRVVLPFKFDFVSDFKNGLAYVEIGDQQCEIDQRGRLFLCQPGK